MKIALLKTHPLFKNLDLNLPSPTSLNMMWSFGSMLLLCLVMQVFTGLFLSMHYAPEVTVSFNSMSHIMRDVPEGWLIRALHCNGASMFMLIMYLHIGRGLFYNSFILKEVWVSGLIIFLLTMATAFLGYVLPWGQMSYWGAAVITNLVSALPYVGEYLVQWLWGGFSVNNATLNRFFSLHFILPFVLILMAVLHILFLHETGSNNPLGISSNVDKISFHPLFTIKDLVGLVLATMILMMISTFYPMSLNDPENFIPANPMVTPVHIQPEWYFLFAYAILRLIPNKLGGVVALVMSILMLASFPISMKMFVQSNKFYPFSKFYLWMFFSGLILLTWIGANPVEEPYTLVGMILTINHFTFFIINPIMVKLWHL
uniref:Cytochrome b n=1 Tax=Rhynchothorax sp. JZ-2022 TaxID=2992009 RepID=A0A9E7V7B5_9CHEL|nr:cytochrome b [Rhynchothorax sp. JZ-2022]